MSEREGEPAGANVTRRRAVALCASAAAGALGALLGGCGASAGAAGAERRVRPRDPEPARLYARPRAPGTSLERTPAVAPGMSPLGLASGRDGLLYVPAGYRPEAPAPLAVLLHGAGGAARGGISPLLAFADANGLILLAPDSRGQTWDFVRGPYGPDVAFIDRALARVFGRLAVDPARVGLGGFSDGASYALGVGLTNGDLFARIAAFSPCFSLPPSRHGKPRILISHGTRDRVLPIDQCSRQIVPALRRDGYDVEYREFDGPHAVPEDVARAAAEWLAAR